MYDYEQRYNVLLSFPDAVRLYMEYDIEWEIEKQEVRQYMDFLRDNHRAYISADIEESS